MKTESETPNLHSMAEPSSLQVLTKSPGCELAMFAVLAAELQPAPGAI